MELDEPANQREADAEAASRPIEGPIRLHVHVKDKRQQSRRDAEPRVLDAEHRVVAVGAERHANVATCRRVLDRVRHDVGEYLFEPGGIRIDPCRLRADLDLTIQPCVGGLSGDRSAYRLGEVDRLPIEPDLARNDPLDIE
jgi:hypothetical protein